MRKRKKKSMAVSSYFTERPHYCTLGTTYSHSRIVVNRRAYNSKTSLFPLKRVFISQGSCRFFFIQEIEPGKYFILWQSGALRFTTNAIRHHSRITVATRPSQYYYDIVHLHFFVQ